MDLIFAYCERGGVIGVVPKDGSLRAVCEWCTRGLRPKRASSALDLERFEETLYTKPGLRVNFKVASCDNPPPVEEVPQARVELIQP